MSKNYITPWYGNIGNVSRSVSKKLNAYKNHILFQNYFVWLMNIAKKEFRTNGLPPTMDQRFIEDNFIYNGKIAAYDMYGKPWSMSVNPYDTLTIFRRPAKGECITGDGHNYQATFYWEYLDNLNESNAVIGYDNEEEYPFIFYIMYYAEKLADAMASINTAVKLSKLSGIIEVPEEQYNAAISVLEDYDNNMPFIVMKSKKGGLPLDINVFNFNNDSGRIKDLWDNYNNLKSEALSMFGIGMNNNQDKKERMTQIEVIGNDNLPMITEDMRLQQRKMFYDMVNKKFGTNITIESNYNKMTPEDIEKENPIESEDPENAKD